MKYGQLLHEHPLGKGEVVSSILTGSTTESPPNKAFLPYIDCIQTSIGYATKREHDASTRGESVEKSRFVRMEENMATPVTPESFRMALNELIALCEDAGLDDHSIIEALKSVLDQYRSNVMPSQTDDKYNQARGLRPLRDDQLRKILQLSPREPMPPKRP
jgi:hypothetical protein